MKTRVSDEQTATAAQIERELIQLDILRRLPDGEHLTLASDHPEGVRQLARWRGIPLSKSSDSDTSEDISISELWRNRIRVTLIVASYNYGHYLDEAVTSVLNQSYLPDEIILSDDASHDESPTIMRRYAAAYPNLIRLNLNETNQGIQAHFNQAVGKATGDLVAIIGADNRIPANYVESLLTALAIDDGVGVAYTDFALFGGRARNDYERMLPQFQGEKLPNGVFLSHFPDYNTDSQALLSQGHNFIHGSSMYRKSVFDAVGGYINRKDGPEDMSLFQAMLATGLRATKIERTILEYRQHSAEQANYQFSYFGELQRLRQEAQALDTLRSQYAELHTRYTELEATHQQQTEALEGILRSKSFRLGRALVAPLNKIRALLAHRR